MRAFKSLKVFPKAGKAMRTDLKPESATLRPESPNLRPERAYLRPERAI